MFRRKMKAVLFSAMALGVVFMGGTAYGETAAADNYTMKLGRFEVTALQDAGFEMDASYFRNADPEVVKKYMPTGKTPASINTYLIKAGKKIILIDAGNGDNGAFGSGWTLANLAKAGVKPEDVDMVLLTHAHADHVGCLVKDGKPVFPRARILLAKAEVPTVDNAGFAKIPEEYKKYFVAANAAINAYGKRVKVFLPGARIIKGITAVDMPAHTPGHTGFLIESEGRKLLMCGDILHVAAVQFPHPEYSFMYDPDVENTARMRKAVLTRASAENLMIAGSHIPFPGIGSVTQENGEFVFTPVK